MGIRIQPGKSVIAEQELWSFIAAYPINKVGNDGEADLYWLPAGREDEADMFKLMVYNKYLGQFDIEAYILGT